MGCLFRTSSNSRDRTGCVIAVKEVSALDYSEVVGAGVSDDGDAVRWSMGFSPGNEYGPIAVLVETQVPLYMNSDNGNKVVYNFLKIKGYFNMTDYKSLF